MWYNSNKMIDFSSKKVQLAVRFFTYGVMAVSTILLTIVAIYYAMGYRLSPSGLVIEQGGIMEFRSEPSDASVRVDGKTIDRRTPGRAYVGPGNHAVQMQLQGYRPWEKSATVLPGQLLWLDYVRFVPQTITTTGLKDFATLTTALTSPDQRWILLQEQSNSPTFIFADISNEKSPTLSALTIPADLLTKKDNAMGKLTPLEWSHDSRYVLVRHDNGEIHDLLRLDRAQPESTINLTQRFSLPLGEAHFAGNNAHIFYALVNKNLHRFDIGATVTSAPLVADVTQFSVYDDRVAFVAARQDSQQVGLYQDGRETLVASAPADKQVRVALTEYFRHQYLAYTLGDAKVVIVSDPTTSQPSSSLQFALDAPADWLAFSPKGRFVVAGNGDQFGGFDLEVSRPYSAALGMSKAPQWLDAFHFWTDNGGILRMHEFDGQNTNDISGVTGGFSAALSPNEKAILSIAKNESGGFTLQASRLVN